MAALASWEPVQSIEQLGSSTGEWYADFQGLKPLLQRELQYTDSILVLTGPQASTLHEDLHDSGYRGVTAVHSSSTLIQAWRQKYADNNKSTINCQVADIAEGLAFDHRPYNAAIDKGSLDALLCKETGLQETEAALKQVFDNLKAPGTFMWLTHGSPDLRMPLLNKLPWQNVAIRAILEPKRSAPPEQQAAPAAAAASGPKKGKAAASPAGSLQLVTPAAGATYLESTAYLYICKKPYV